MGRSKVRCRMCRLKKIPRVVLDKQNYDGDGEIGG